MAASVGRKCRFSVSTDSFGWGYQRWYTSVGSDVSSPVDELPAGLAVVASLPRETSSRDFRVTSSRDLRCLRFFLRLCFVAAEISGIGEVGSGRPCPAAWPRVGETVGE